MIKIKYTKKEEQIINNYLNSGRNDQTLKNAQMMATIYNLVSKIEKLEKRIEKLEGREKNE